MSTNDDRLSIVLLCSTVGGAREAATSPLGPAGWSGLAARLEAAGVRPGRLLEISDRETAAVLGLSDDQATRIAGLLRRAGPAAIEIERLADRGFWVMTVLDADYPQQLGASLGSTRPPVLFGSGDRGLLSAQMVAVVGSRDASADSLAFAREVGRAAAEGDVPIVSGGARGVDTEAATGALESSGGKAVLVLVEQLERRIRDPETRRAVEDERLTVVSPYPPAAGFSVRGAMGRNKVVYGLARSAIVVTAKPGSGGTWAGAEEALRGGWVPVFVRGSADPGSQGLERLGAVPLEWPEVPVRLDLDRLRATEAASPRSAALVQETLFGGDAAAGPAKRRGRKRRAPEQPI